jgi:hypothetical protein
VNATPTPLPTRRARLRPRGQSLVLVAVSLIMLMGFAGIAIDVGAMMLTRNELQNAADAAALAGAGALYQKNVCPAPPASCYDSAPNWTRGRDTTINAVKPAFGNKVTHVALDSSVVTWGWWNLTGTPAGMQSPAKSPTVTGDAAAVRVRIVKSTGQNSGPLRLFLAPLMGVNTQPMQASAVAVVSYPSSIAPHESFPTAINNCMYGLFWDFTTNSPKIDPLTGLPFVFRIGSSYHYGACDSGQWTSMFTDANDVPTVRDLIINGNPTPVAIGDSIWIQPGTKNSLYNDVIVPSTTLLPVVQDVSSSTHAKAMVMGFGPFMITASVGGASKYIEGHFVAGYEIPIATGGGPAYGAYVPPILAQ